MHDHGSGARQPGPERHARPGTMAAAIRDRDWSDGPLGDIRSWTHSLRSAVDMALASPLPMVVVWSQDHVQLFNDACARLLSDPGGRTLGLSVLTARLAHLSPSLIEAVKSGDSRTMPVRVAGEAGETQGQEGWYDVSCMPIRDELGHVSGSLLIFAHRGAAPEIAEARHLQSVIDRLPVGVATVDAVTGRVLYLNPAGLAMHGFHRPEEMIEELSAYGDQFDYRDLNERPLPFDQWPVVRALRGEQVLNQVVIARQPGHSDRVLSYSADPPTPTSRTESEIVVVVQDLTEGHRAQQAQRQTYSLLDGITQGTNDLIAALDTDFRFTFFNEAYRREFEHLWHQELEIGTSLLEALARWPEQMRRAKHLWQRALHGESFHVTEHFGPTPEELQVYDLEFNPVRDPHTGLVGAAHILRNVTERVRMQQALRDSEAQLQEADQRKDEFLATLAHELRNPLAPIKSSIDILRLTDSPEDIRNRLVPIMERQMGQLVRMVDDLLDASRVSRGAVEMQFETLELADVLREAVDSLRMTDRMAQRQLDLQLDGHTMPVQADRVRLLQIFNNLLNNAVKFTHGDGRIVVSAARHHDVIRITCRDDGTGIERGMLDRVFDLFTQERPGAAGGLGIGLALVRNLVGRHGGHIQVRSEGKGRGTEFLVTLPCTEAEGAPGELTK